MRNLALILLFLLRYSFCFSQKTTIDYWKNEKNSFTINSKTYLNGHKIETEKKVILKDKLTFKLNDLKIYFTTTQSPFYTNLESSILKNIEIDKMPTINYTTILCLIISSSGKLIYTGIFSGFGYPYDNEVIKAVNKLKCWTPGKYGDKDVDCLTLIYYDYIFK